MERANEKSQKEGKEWMDRSENESKKITIKLSMEEETDQGADQRYFPGGFGFVLYFVQLRIAKVKPSRKVPLIST